MKPTRQIRPVIRETGIPMAIRVKENILDVADAVSDQIGTVVYRARRGQDINKELWTLQGSLAVLYQKLKAKFPKGNKIHEFGDAIINNTDLSFKELIEVFDIFIYKIEDLKITKFERKEIPKEEVLA